MDYLDEYNESQSDNEDNYTPEDYLNNEYTRGILEDEHFEKFKSNMVDTIEDFYNEQVHTATIDYMDMFDKDFHKKKAYDFFLTIYPFIVKSYDFSIFDKFPFLSNYLNVKDDEEEEQIKEPKKIINSKIYDWNAKKI
jgi:hypothetical protein